MHNTKILVIGAYGFFGRRLVERLSTQPALHIIMAGRSGVKAETLARELRPGALCELDTVTVDAMSPAFAAQLTWLNPAVVVNACGPFQGQDYRVAEACIAAGVHYIDLADGREFVLGIGALNTAALRAGVLVVTGASSVPALSSAAADHLVRGLHAVKTIDVGISPGNRTERGLSTIQSVLSYCGKPLPGYADEAEIGWLGTYRHAYADPVGSRLHSPCDVPDLALFPARYSGQPKVRFGAGLELEFLHRGMNLMAWAAHHGFVKNWAAHANWLKRAGDLFQYCGTDAGAMRVAVTGVNWANGVSVANEAEQAVSREWQLVATHGDGPYVPTLATSALVRKIATGNYQHAGAMPCMGLLTLEDFCHEMQGLHITTSQIQ